MGVKNTETSITRHTTNNPVEGLENRPVNPLIVGLPIKIHLQCEEVPALPHSSTFLLYRSPPSPQISAAKAPLSGSLHQPHRTVCNPSLRTALLRSLVTLVSRDPSRGLEVSTGRNVSSKSSSRSCGLKNLSLASLVQRRGCLHQAGSHRVTGSVWNQAEKKEQRPVSGLKSCFKKIRRFR